MHTAARPYHIRTGTQPQMICVPQNNPRVEFVFQRLEPHTLDRRLCPNRHKHRRLNFAAPCLNHTRPRRAFRIARARREAVRNVFVVGPDKKVKLTLTYPASTGRNFNELLRVIDSLQLTAKHKVATPSDWKQGEDVIIVPAVSDEDAKAIYPDGWDAKKPYLRLVKQPGS